MKKNKVDIIWGEAVADRPGEIKVAADQEDRSCSRRCPAPKNALGEGTYKAKNIIIATGARPRVLPGIEPDGDRIWTYFEAMVPAAMPKSLVVMGSGAIGMEFASFYRSMGAEVTIIELLPQILPVEDAEIAAHVRKRFEKRGIKILTDAKVSQGRQDQGRRRRACRAQGRQQAADRGRAADLGRRRAVQHREPRAREGRREDRPRRHRRRRPWPHQRAGIWAIGDVAGPPMLAHKAEHEAVIAVETIAGLKVHGLDKRKVPGCTYCEPQVASVGLTEAKAKEAVTEGMTVGRDDLDWPRQVVDVPPSRKRPSSDRHTSGSR